MTVSSGPKASTLRRAAAAFVCVVTLAGAAVWWTSSRGSDLADHDWSAIAASDDPVPAVRAPSARTARNNLAALDPCKLGAAGDSAARAVRGDPGTCTVHRWKGTVTVQTLVAYRNYAPLVDPAFDALISRERIEIDGIAAWVGTGPVGRRVEVDDAACAVVVPASLEVAAAFVGNSEDCELATQTATDALADLERLTYAQPLPAACDFLAAVVTGALHQDQASCRGGGMTLVLGSSPLDDALGSARPVEVQGMAMREADGNSICAYEWALGTDVDVKPVRAMLTRSLGYSCAKLRTAAARIAAAADPPTPKIVPPVFYAADEPDPGGVGDCSELADQLAWLCAPSETRAISSDPVEVIREGEADPATLCTAALESLDRPMLAVTTAQSPPKLATRESYRGPRQCTLLEPTEGGPEASSTTILISASRDPLETNGNTTIAGHPAYYSAQTGSWEVALTEPTERGFLRIRVEETSAQGRAEPSWAKEFVTDFVQRVWSE